MFYLQKFLIPYLSPILSNKTLFILNYASISFISSLSFKTLFKTNLSTVINILAPRVVKVEITPLEVKKESFVKEEKRVEKVIEKLDEDILNKAKNNIEKYLEKFIPLLKISDIKYEVSINNPFININIEGEDVNNLIGHRGETLNELQNILSGIASKGSEKRVRAILDISNYKQKREKNLEELAEKIAKTVIRNKKNITLEPMNAYERKIIHTKLQNHSKVVTKSIGEEPYRKVVVCLKK